MALNSKLKQILWQWQWFKLHLWMEWMQISSGIHSGSPPDVTVVRWQMTVAVQSKWGSSAFNCCISLQRAEYGLWLLTLLCVITTLRSFQITTKQVTSEKCIWLCTLPSVIFWNTPKAAIMLHQFLGQKWKCLVCTRCWYSLAVLIKTIQRSCSFFELKKQVLTPFVSLAVVLAENWCYQCFLFQTYLLNDFHYTIPSDYLIYKHSPISSQFNIVKPLVLGCIFLHALLEKALLGSRALLGASRIGSSTPCK